MLQASDSFGRRVSGSGLGLATPTFILIAVILVVWLVVELLLAGRFWIQLTGAEKTTGLNEAVLTLSGPLVAPFSQFQPAGTGEPTGTFEFGTVVAAEAYLILAIVLVIASLLIGNTLALASVLAPRTKSSKGRLAAATESAAFSARSARLCNTFFLPLPADDALAALHNLTLDRFQLEFVTIPAQGGSVVAVFAPSPTESLTVPIISRFRMAREEHHASRLLESIGATVFAPAPTTAAATAGR